MQIKYDRGASNTIEEASILVFKRVYVMQISLVKHIKTALVSMLWGYKPTHLDSFLIIIKSLKGDEEGRNTFINSPWSPQKFMEVVYIDKHLLIIAPIVIQSNKQLFA